MKKILIIEDNEELRPMLVGLLTDAGYLVDEAADGTTGYNLYLSGRHDLIITDIVMPDKDGLELIFALRYADPRPRIIAISGDARFGEKVYLPMAERFGVQRAFAKPVPPQTLLASVAEELAKPAPAPVPRRPEGGGFTMLLLAVLWLALPAAAMAVTHAQLLGDPDMNARRYANYFRDFKYYLCYEVQAVDSFLRTQRGDCDDYAILADEVLKRRNLRTVLVHIRLAGMIAHAVCYVEPDKAYLDYNNRNVFFTLSRCRPSLRAIAEKVADSLEANWTSASVFTYSYATGQKQMIMTIAETDRSAPDRLPETSTGSALLVQ